MIESDEGGQPFIGGNVGFTNPSHMTSSNILHLTNPENELYKMELTFRGKILDKDGNEIKIGDPLMNEFGVSSVMGLVQSIVSQVTIMSNLDKQDIPLLIDFLADTLCRDLMINRIPYDISGRVARDNIFFTTLSSAYITMKRSFEEGDRRFWKGSVQEIKSTVDTGGKKKGMLSRMWDN